MDWSPHTLNLNIIEALLDHLDKELNKRQQASRLLIEITRKLEWESSGCVEDAE